MFRKIIKGLKDVWCGTLEFDTEPKKDSFNPVTSGGVYDAINGAGGAKEIVYFDVDPSDPPSGLHTAIGEALSNNKLPVLKIDGAVYFYTATGTDKHVFVGGYTKEAVGYTEIEVSDDDSVTSKSVDDKVFNMYMLYRTDPASPGDPPGTGDQPGAGYWICDENKHVITKTELMAAHANCRYFVLNNDIEPDSNTRKYFASVTVISNSNIRILFSMIQTDDGSAAEFTEKLVMADSEGRLYVLRSYEIYLAGTNNAVLVSEPQSFDSTQKAQGRSNIGAASASDVTALQSQVSSLSDVSAYAVKGEATVAQLNAGPSGIQAGWAYQLTDSGTLTDGSLAVVAGDTVAWDGTKWFPLVKSDYYATKTYAQNVAHSIAPEFDPSKPNDEGGYAYYKDEIVTNNGTTYRFKVNHLSGAWNPAEVERYVASESLKFFVVTNSPEYLYAITDENDRFLFGVRKDGTFVVAKYSDLIDGLASKVDKETGKSLVDDSWANSLVDETNGEYKYAVVDVNDKLLFGIKESGEFYFAMSSEKVDDDWIKALLSIDNDEYSKVTTDNRNRLLDAVRKNGLHEFFTKMKFSGGVDWTSENMAELSNALKAYGILGGTGDWSDAKSLQIPKPKLAIINITNITTMPTTKTADAKAIMQFWDLNGNYFKKKVIMNAQGNSTLVWPKKNASFDICNDDWVGDDTFKLKIGDWVEQDSFHLKAGYNDFLRSGVGEVCYDFYKQILDTRNVNENRSWKLALLNDINTRWAGRGYGITESVKERSDCGALCFPQGFPCVIYLNDEFYGVFAFQLKKHRDNYMMGKSTKTNIHLDGRLGSAFFTGSINWTDFEVRNPKDLYTMDGNKYDGDDPKELIDPTSASYDTNNSKHVNTYFVKQKIIALSQVYARVSAEQTDAGKKAIVESVFNIPNLIDYQAFCDVTYNYDGIEKNWQWTTWDGDHWFVNAYDLDGCFGAYFQGTAIFSPHTAKMGNVNGLPSKYVLDFYDSDLDARYAELRRNKVIDTDNIVSMLLDWDNAISKFKKVEFEKWSGASCNKDIVVDSHWEIVEEDGVPVISYSPFADYYNPETAYSVGDVVSYNYTNGFRWAYKLRCVESSIGNPPITTFGFKDSVWRLKTWIDENLENMDTAYSFDN